MHQLLNKFSINLFINFTSVIKRYNTTLWKITFWHYLPHIIKTKNNRVLHISEEFQIKLTLLDSHNENNSYWIKNAVKVLLKIEIDDLTDDQIKLLDKLFTDNLKDGMNPKDALKKAFRILNCFL